MNSPFPDRNVCAIVVNFNGGEWIRKCLDSLSQQTHLPIEIIVIDNASSDGSDDVIEKNYPEVHLIRNITNLGWGVACNQGIQSCNSRYICLMNNDAWLDPHCLEEMVLTLESNPKAGSCASKILLPDGERIEVCGLSISRDGSSFGRGRLQLASLFDSPEEVFCANDCCCLYRRSMIEDVGLYDPDFFIYCDETDMGFRHQMAGWRCLYAPKAIAYHAHSLTAGAYSPFKAYHVERNRILLIWKYFPIADIPLAFALSIWRYLLQVIEAKKGSGALGRFLEKQSLGSGFKILLSAHRDAFKMLPTMWRRRRTYHKIQRMNRKGFHKLFTNFGVPVSRVASYE
jgi:GT2 family glycosyltransferase